METLNIGMIGAGFMGKAHSTALAAMPMFFWPAPAIPIRKVVAEATEDLAREAAARFGFQSHASDWRQVIEDSSVDAVDIVTPNNLHAEIAIAAARAGKHILCEKPLAATSEEARGMLDAVERAGVIHMVAFNYRRTPAVLLAKKLIDDGAIGTLLNYRATYLQDFSADPLMPITWRHQKSVAGSGTLGDIASHAIDMARFLVGEIAAVSGMVHTYIKERPEVESSANSATQPSTSIVDVDDEVVSLLRFENGVVGSLEATRNGYGRHNHLTFEAHGTDGSIVFNYEHRDVLQVFFASDPPDLRGFRTIFTGPQHPYGEGLWPIPALGLGYIETKIIECYDFVKAIIDATLPSPNFLDGYRITRICDAILESSSSHGWIHLDWKEGA
ncbi:MAG: Gfo/Idh/MocA family protein [Chloroflexota bacterium]|nr:MAG: dehydrogenase [Chloroflexota bacterium]